MLTKNKIKKFCIDAIGVFLVDADKDIQIERCRGHYSVTLKNKRAPDHIIQHSWEFRSKGTEFERVYFNVNGLWEYHR